MLIIVDDVYKKFSFIVSHVCHFDIDCDILTAHCGSSPADLLNLAHVWWVLIQSIVGIVRGRQ